MPRHPEYEMLSDNEIYRRALEYALAPTTSPSTRSAMLHSLKFPASISSLSDPEAKALLEELFVRVMPMAQTLHSEIKLELPIRPTKHLSGTVFASNAEGICMKLTLIWVLVQAEKPTVDSVHPKRKFYVASAESAERPTVTRKLSSEEIERRKQAYDSALIREHVISSPIHRIKTCENVLYFLSLVSIDCIGNAQFYDAIQNIIRLSPQYGSGVVVYIGSNYNHSVAFSVKVHPLYFTFTFFDPNSEDGELKINLSRFSQESWNNKIREVIAAGTHRTPSYAIDKVPSGFVFLCYKMYANEPTEHVRTEIPRDPHLRLHCMYAMVSCGGRGGWYFKVFEALLNGFPEISSSDLAAPANRYHRNTLALALIRYSYYNLLILLIKRLTPDQLSIRSPLGWTPFYFAVQEENTRAVKLLVNVLTPEQIQIGQGNWTPLDIAYLKNLTQIADMIETRLFPLCSMFSDEEISFRILKYAISPTTSARVRVDILHALKNPTSISHLQDWKAKILLKELFLRITPMAQSLRLKIKLLLAQHHSKHVSGIHYGMGFSKITRRIVLIWVLMQGEKPSVSDVHPRRKFYLASAVSADPPTPDVPLSSKEIKRREQAWEEALIREGIISGPIVRGSDTCENLLRPLKLVSIDCLKGSQFYNKIKDILRRSPQYDKGVVFFIATHQVFLGCSVKVHTTSLTLALFRGFEEETKIFLSRFDQTNWDNKIRDVVESIGISEFLNEKEEAGFVFIGFKIYAYESSRHVSMKIPHDPLVYTPQFRLDCMYILLLCGGNGWYFKMFETLLNGPPELSASELARPLFASELTIAWAVAFYGYTEILTLLVAKGLTADQLSIPAFGITPLYVASEIGYTQFVRTLVDVLTPAHINIPSNGVTPLEIARKLGNTEIVQILENKLLNART